MRRPLALALCLALCLTLTACWEAEANETPEFWEEEPALPEPVAAPDPLPDAFTLPFLSSQTFDPVLCSDGVQQTVGSLLYEGLYTLDDTFTPQPLLCASCRVSSNGLTYTLALRDGIVFSNGAALTAADVLATYRRAQASERFSARFANVASMRVNRGALVVTLRQADSAFPALLDIPIVKSGTEKDTVPLGTGPYLFVTDSDGPCLARNENWWRGGDALPERIRLEPAKDADSAVYLFSAGRAHLLVADLLGETPAAALGGVDMADAPSTALLFLGCNTKRRALADSALRVAIGAAFDRDAIVDTLLAGHADAARFPISPLSPLYPAELDTPYDSAAYPDALGIGSEGEPLELTLLVNAENSFKASLAAHLAKQLSVGPVAVTPVELPWTEYLAALESGDFDLWLGEVRLTADWDVTSLVGSGGALNYGKYASAATDAALKAFLKDENEATAAALCEQLAADAPILPIAFKTVTALTPEGMIEGLSPTATQPLRGCESWTIRFPD